MSEYQNDVSSYSRYLDEVRTLSEDIEMLEKAGAVLMQDQHVTPGKEKKSIIQKEARAYLRRLKFEHAIRWIIDTIQDRSKRFIRLVNAEDERKSRELAFISPQNENRSPNSVHNFIRLVEKVKEESRRRTSCTTPMTVQSWCQTALAQADIETIFSPDEKYGLCIDLHQHYSQFKKLNTYQKYYHRGNLMKAYDSYLIKYKAKKERKMKKGLKNQLPLPIGPSPPKFPHPGNVVSKISKSEESENMVEICEKEDEKKEVENPEVSHEISIIADNDQPAVDSQIMGDMDLPMDIHTFSLNFQEQSVDYIEWLNCFDCFHKIPRYCKYRKLDYYEYIENLLNYLRSYSVKQRPLFVTGVFEGIVKQEFIDIWNRKMVPGFERSTLEEPLYCKVSDKLFTSEGIMDSFRTGKEYRKMELIYQSMTQEEKVSSDEASREHDKEIAYFEFAIGKYSEILKPAIDETVSVMTIKQSRTAVEIERASLSEEPDLLLDFGVTDAGKSWNVQDDRSDSDDDESVSSTDEDALKHSQFSSHYNPLNLPLGWDGKPIPFWLYKLHGLGKSFKCEICGNYTYWGRRAFERHFSEWRHVHGLKCLRIPATKHMHFVTKIEDAISLCEKLRSDAIVHGFNPMLDVECDDQMGNVLNMRTYEDMVKQGLI